MYYSTDSFRICLFYPLFLHFYRNPFRIFLGLLKGFFVNNYLQFSELKIKFQVVLICSILAPFSYWLIWRSAVNAIWNFCETWMCAVGEPIKYEWVLSDDFLLVMECSPDKVQLFSSPILFEGLLCIERVVMWASMMKLLEIVSMLLVVAW